MQLPGVTSDVTKRLTKGANSSKQNNSAVGSIRELRALDRKAASTVLNRVLRGKNSIDNALNHLYSIPVLSITSAAVHHEVDKTSGKSRGKLKLTLEFQREEPPKRRKGSRRDDSSYSLILVLGSFTQGAILGDASLSVPQRNGTWTVSKELEFDWGVANADGGEGKGQMVLRLLWEEIRGFDSEMTIPVN